MTGGWGYSVFPSWKVQKKSPNIHDRDDSGFIAWEELRQRNSIWYVADFIKQVACQLL
jgi:hypothetical protein